MASRTSAMRSQELYLGSRRGRAVAFDMDPKLLEKKWESTPIIEDSPAVLLDDDRRGTIKDYSPDQNSLFPYEQARRNTFARDRLNLREGGARVTTDPWVNSGQDGKDGFDISFHDKDPRGWSTEQNWKEFRRIAEVLYQNTDFKDDGSYQETSGGIHPNTMYKQIRGSQDWLKARMKIFSEEWEGRSNGGVGVFSDTSKVYRSDMEDSSAQTDGLAPSRTFDDPEIAQHHNVNISNDVHLGSKFMRVNNTTDHLVAVAAYGKLYKNRGIIPHESQMRIMEDDTPWSNIEGSKQAPRNLIKMMASQIYSDNPNISPYTASEISRILRQDDQLEDAAHTGISREEAEQSNQHRKLTKDIMALLGVTENEVKFLESKQVKNKKYAEHMMADIKNMITTVHKLSSNEKLQMKNELILRSAGMGLKPSDGRAVMNNVIVNPKLIEFMSQQTNKSGTPTDTSSNRSQTNTEHKTGLNNMPLFVYKSASRVEDLVGDKWNSQGSEPLVDTSRKTRSYKNLKKFAARNSRNTNAGTSTQISGTSAQTVKYNNPRLTDTNSYENMVNTVVDNDFGENRGLLRHTGRIGNKQMRRHMESEMKPTDAMSDMGPQDTGFYRKNPVNMNNLTK